MRTNDLAWLAGLLEGEGSFTLAGPDRRSPLIDLQMKDRDVVERAADMFGRKVFGPLKTRLPHHAPMFRCCVQGRPAVAWMMTLYVLLGVRRRARIKEVLEEWRIAPPCRAPKGSRWVAVCHPDRPLIAKGLCEACYMRQYRMGGPLRNREVQPWQRKRNTKSDLI